MLNGCCLREAFPTSSGPSSARADKTSTGRGLMSGEATGSFSGVRAADLARCYSKLRHDISPLLWAVQVTPGTNCATANDAIIVFVLILIMTLQRQMAFRIWETQSRKRRHTGINWTLFISFFQMHKERASKSKKEPLYLLGKGDCIPLRRPTLPPKFLPLDQYI